MAIIKCKMCGGDIELTADKTFGTCEFCGNTVICHKMELTCKCAYPSMLPID